MITLRDVARTFFAMLRFCATHNSTQVRVFGRAENISATQCERDISHKPRPLAPRPIHWSNGSYMGL